MCKGMFVEIIDTVSAVASNQAANLYHIPNQYMFLVYKQSKMQV